MLANLKIRSKLLMITIITTALLILAYIVLFIQEKSIIHEIKYVSDTSVVYAMQAKEMDKNVVEVQQWLTDISATRALDGLNDGFDEAEISRQKFLTGIQSFEELYNKENNQAGLETLNALKISFENWYQAGKVMAQGYVDGGPTSGNKLMGAFDDEAVKLGEILNHFVNEQSVIAHNHLTNVNEEAIMLRNSLTALFLIIFVTLWGMSLLIIRSIDLSINHLKESMQSVMRNGLLKQQVSPQSNDEIGQTTAIFNELLTTLYNIINETNDVVSALSEGNLTKRITSEQKGDFDTLKQAVNNSADNIQDVLTNLTNISTSLKNGEFDLHIENAAQGQYRTIQENMEASIKNLCLTVIDVNSVMTDMKNGNFDTRVNVETNGALAEMKQSINSSMSMLSSAMSDISRVVSAQSQGDLSQNIGNTYAGEIESIKDSINQSNQTLNNIVGQIINISHSVAGDASEVSHGSIQLSKRTQQMAESLSESSARMQTITSSTQQNTQLAQQATQLANQTSQHAANGANISKQAIQAMNNITDSSEKINDIISLIDGIAFQTNLLALNAAVEAARAGEHGKGFAVVAGEVRALAQKSAGASKEIKVLIEHSSKNVEEGSKHVVQTGEALGQINTAINDVNNLIIEISNSSNEQAQVIEQVNNAIQQIDNTTQQNASLADQTVSTAQSMNTQAGSLQAEIRFFKETGSNQAKTLTFQS